MSVYDCDVNIAVSTYRVGSFQQTQKKTRFVTKNQQKSRLMTENNRTRDQEKKTIADKKTRFLKKRSRFVTKNSIREKKNHDS